MNIQHLKLVIILEYQNIKNIFVKGKWTIVGTFVGTFYKKELQKTNQKEFRVEKVIKRKGDKLYVEWKRYDNSFNIKDSVNE